MPREKFEFTVLNDDDFNDAADILEAITLWHKAIKAGRLSATKNDDGNYLIDAAELFRVYQPVTSTISKDSVNLVDNISNQLIVQELEFTKQMLKQVESERDNLRVSLNQAMMLITHQPQPGIQQPELQPVKPSLYERLFGRKR